MKNNIIGYCPICDKKLHVKTLKCESCGSEISGEFNLSKFDYLTKEQQEFALLFIRSQGNIKQIEKVMNISYPTVKKNLDDLIKALGYSVVEQVSRDEVKRRLKNGEISFEEAEIMLGEKL